MKKNALFGRITAILLIICIIVPTGTAARKTRAESSVTGIIRATELYMREGAGTEYGRVSIDGTPVLLKYGQEVTVLGETNGWYYLRAVFDGSVVTGYSLSRKGDVIYIEIPDGSSVAGSYRSGKVTATTLNVRKGPATTYDKVKLNGADLVLTSGQEVSIIEQTGDWYHVYVTVGGTRAEGYCYADYIEAGETQAFSEPEYSYGTVIATKLNVRSGPGTENAIVKSGGSNVVLTSGCEVTILDETNGWYHIMTAVNGNLVEGYCLGSYIQIKENSKAPDNGKSGSGKEDTGKNGDPGARDEKPADPAQGDQESGTEKPFSLTDLSNGIPEGYEKAEKKFSAKYAIPAKVTAKTGLNMRSKAQEGSEVITVLSFGQEVTILDTKRVYVTAADGSSVKEKWYRIAAFVDGTYIVGYVVNSYLEITDFTGVNVKTSYSKQKVYKKLTTNTKLKNPDGTLVRLKKGTVLPVIGDGQDASGNKRFKVTFEYNGKTVNAYVPAGRVAFVSTMKSYTFEYLVPVEEKPSDKPLPADDEGEDTSAEPAPSGSFEGANAVVLDAAGLAVRREAKNSSDMLYTPDGKAVLLYTGDPVEITDVVTDGSRVWCYVRLYFNGSEYYGYIRSTHLESEAYMSLLSSQATRGTSAVDFETKLANEGFPESYRVLLRELHEKYPLWEFSAYHTGLDWNQAVAAESEVGVSLLPNYYGVEWLSFAEGAYSWKNDKFTVFDGSYWVAASEAAVRYYMDPRNFLTPTGIFMFENLTYNPSIQTKEGAADILKTTAFGNGATYKYTDDLGEKRKATYVDTFLMAAEYSGVSLYHLASRSKNEIGNGTPSNSVSGTVEGYEGLYNFYNVGANDSATPGQNIVNGLKFAKNGRGSETLNRLYMIPWSNPFRAILGGAYYIGYNYVSKGQDTLYFERFNVVTDGTYPVFTHQYMTNVAAASSESASTARGYENASAMALEFTIPVYLNMPEETCTAPEKAYNPNNWLKTLAIYDTEGNELGLTPTFDYTAKQAYSLIVDHDVSTVFVDATTVSKLARITSASQFSLDYGENLIKIKVKAENGDERKYKIYIYREEDPEAADTAPVEDDGSESTDEAKAGQADADDAENTP